MWETKDSKEYVDHSQMTKNLGSPTGTCPLSLTQYETIDFKQRLDKTKEIDL